METFWKIRIYLTAFVNMVALQAGPWGELSKQVAPKRAGLGPGGSEGLLVRPKEDQTSRNQIILPALPAYRQV